MVITLAQHRSAWKSPDGESGICYQITTFVRSWNELQ
jgi:hypothetical protein